MNEAVNMQRLEVIQHRAGFNCTPRDILRDILIRLPTKSLLRFKCVCKDWYNIISDPDFEPISDPNFSVKCLRSKIMMVFRIEDECHKSPYYYSIYKLEKNGSIAEKFVDLCDRDGEAVGSCNSLVLFERKREWKSLHVLVYDAFNHRRKLLPPLEFLASLSRCYSLVNDSSTKKYKVLWVCL